MDVKQAYRSDAHKEFARLDENVRTFELTFAYFMLTVNTASIGFAIQQSISLKLNIYIVALGLALVSWIIAFVNGVLLIRYLIASARFERDQLGDYIVNKEAPFEQLKKYYDSITVGTAKKNTKLYVYMVAGIFFFIVWYIIKLYFNPVIAETKTASIQHCFLISKFYVFVS